jgi:hypothetical protein
MMGGGRRWLRIVSKNRILVLTQSDLAVTLSEYPLI